MFSIVVVVHIVLCLSLMGLVLVQQGKGADAGAIMGGGADGLMGAGGATDVISKTTTALAIGFMITSIVLVKFYDQAVVTRSSGEASLSGSVMSDVAAPVVESEAEAVSAETEATEETAPATADAEASALAATSDEAAAPSEEAQAVEEASDSESSAGSETKDVLEE